MPGALTKVQAGHGKPVATAGLAFSAAREALSRRALHWEQGGGGAPPLVEAGVGSKKPQKAHLSAQHTGHAAAVSGTADPHLLQTTPSAATASSGPGDAMPFNNDKGHCTSERPQHNHKSEEEGSWSARNWWRNSEQTHRWGFGNRN